MRRYQNVVMDSQRWDGFEFREGDIVISTPSKCGTTWMQMMCALLIFQDPVLPRPLTRLSPWLDVQTESPESVFTELAAQTHRRFIKTHTPFDGIPHDERVTYICVARDPRDVALSWDNHFNNLNLAAIMGRRAEAVGLDDLAELMPEGIPEQSEDPIERFWLWIDAEPAMPGGIDTLQGMLHHVDTFWSHRHDDNVVLFHYADMKADLEREMRRLAAALHIDVDEDRWPQLVEAATFDRMRDRAEELAPQVVEGFWNDSNRFFHKGVSGQWREFFTDDDSARYDARARSLASPEMLAWVHEGSHPAVTH